MPIYAPITVVEDCLSRGIPASRRQPQRGSVLLAESEVWLIQQIRVPEVNLHAGNPFAAVFV